MKPFLVIAHSQRCEAIPHWFHASTLAALHMPPRYVHMYESHIFDIGRSRTALVEAALRIPEVTHILFIDDDIIIPDPLTLVLMLNFLETHPADIVSGLYYSRARPHFPLLMGVEEAENKLSFIVPRNPNAPIRSAVVKVDIVPGGFLLVTRRVFETVQNPWFVYADQELTAKTGSHDNPPGEDIYFSLKAAHAGFDLYVDCRKPLLHYVPEFVGPSKLVDSFVYKGTLSRVVREFAEKVEREQG